MNDKILTLDQLPPWRASLRDQGRRLVVTNGCFDILHAGHVNYLQAARALGDVLLVGLNSDASIRQLKGPERPINPEADRAFVLAALEAVSAVSIFPDLRATRFLRIAQPDIYVKGGDLTVGDLPAEERDAVHQCSGQIRIMPHLPGRSTTAILQRIRALG